jgi:hypothetical protein
MNLSVKNKVRDEAVSKGYFTAVYRKITQVANDKSLERCF